MFIKNKIKVLAIIIMIKRLQTQNNIFNYQISNGLEETLAADSIDTITMYNAWKKNSQYKCNTITLELFDGL